MPRYSVQQFSTVGTTSPSKMQSTVAPETSVALVVQMKLKPEVQFAKYSAILLTLSLAVMCSFVFVKTIMSFRSLVDIVNSMESMESVADASVVDGSTMENLKSFGAFYAILCVSFISCILHVAGCVGSLFNLQNCLKFYTIFTLFFVVMSSIGCAVWVGLAEEKTIQFFHKFIETYTKNYYGSESYSLLDTFVDDLHRSNQCCGMNIPQGNGSATYRVILYFLESANYGQFKAAKISWMDDGVLNMVPSSCCVKEHMDCSKGAYKSRFAWSEDAEKTWSEKLYTANCKKKLETLWSIMTSTVITAVLIVQLMLTVLAVILSFYLWRQFRMAALMTPCIGVGRKSHTNADRTAFSPSQMYTNFLERKQHKRHGRNKKKDEGRSKTAKSRHDYRSVSRLTR